MNTISPAPAPAEKDPVERSTDAVPAQSENLQTPAVPVDDFMRRIREMFPLKKQSSMRGFGDLG